MNKPNNQTFLPFWQGLFYPFTVIKNNKNYLRLTLIFALFLTTTTFLLGRSYLCNFNNTTLKLCSNSPLLSIISIMFFWITNAIYANRLLLITSTNISIKQAIKTKNYKQDLKTLLIIFLNITAWTAIITSIYILAHRKATPNFFFELGYFTLFSFIIFIALIYLLNNVLTYRFIENKKYMLLNKTFWTIFDNLYKFLIWFLLSFMFFSWIFKSIIIFTINSIEKNNILFYFMSEFMLTYAILSVTTYWILHLQFQEKHLFKEEY